MRLVYSSDLHGNLTRYEQLLELAATHTAQAIVVGGDLLPNTVRIDEAIAGQREFIIRYLRPLITEFHAAHPDITLYLLPGNDDWAAAVATLHDMEREGLLCMLHDRALALTDQLWLAGYACVPITPFSVKDFERHDGGDVPLYSFAMAYSSESGQPEKISLPQLMRKGTIATGLADLARKSRPAQTIYVTHAPPYDTNLDIKRGNKHVGSQSLRAFIDQHQPPLTLHGHIHESPQLSGHYATRLGTTWCVNPGHDYQTFDAVLLDTDDIAGTLWHTRHGTLS